MEGKYLPIGTVVLLKGGSKRLMINSYLVFQSTDGTSNGFINGTAQVFDYGACVYPEGVLDVHTSYAFNHDQIERIDYMGFVCDEQKDLSSKLVQGYEMIKKQQGQAAAPAPAEAPASPVPAVEPANV